MCPNDNSNNKHELCIEFYRNIRERLTSQGDRLWLRFRYFLTIEAAIFGAFVLKPELLRSKIYLWGFPIFGFLWSLLWYLIAINDLWFYEERYRTMKLFEDENILPVTELTRYKLENDKRNKPSGWKRLICCKFKKCGSTTFSAIIPFVFMFLWLLLLIIGLLFPDFITANR